MRWANPHWFRPHRSLIDQCNDLIEVINDEQKPIQAMKTQGNDSGSFRKLADVLEGVGARVFAVPIVDSELVRLKGTYSRMAFELAEASRVAALTLDGTDMERASAAIRNMQSFAPRESKVVDQINKYCSGTCRTAERVRRLLEVREGESEPEELRRAFVLPIRRAENGIRIVPKRTPTSNPPEGPTCRLRIRRRSVASRAPCSTGLAASPGRGCSSTPGVRSVPAVASEEDVSICPRCQGPTTWLEVATEPDAITELWSSMDLPRLVLRRPRYLP